MLSLLLFERKIEKKVKCKNKQKKGKTISFISLMTSTILGINTFGSIQLSSSSSPSHLFFCVFLFLADPLCVSSQHVAEDKHSLSAHQRNGVCQSHVVHLQRAVC